MNTKLHPLHTELNLYSLTRSVISIAAFIAGASVASAQTTSAPATDPEGNPEEVVVLSPFTVDASQDRGYQATSTLAGTRIRTNLADVGSAISVLTKELINDLGGYNNETVLSYAVNTEVAGPRGNFSGANRGGNEGHIDELASFANPNGNTRVRGLVSADNTRDFFLSDVPWDGYNISRVDLQRGPNAILFGLGSPAGVINAAIRPATFQRGGSFEFMFDEFGTQRYVLDYNHVVLDRELAVRLSLLDNKQKFQQEPAFQHDRRAFGAIKYAPAQLNRPGQLFEVNANFEHGEISSNRPRQVTPEDLISPFFRPVSLGGVNKKTFDPYRDYWDEGFEPHTTYNNVTTDDFGGSLQLNNAGLPYGFIRQDVPAFGARRPDGSIIDTTTDASGGIFGGGGMRNVVGIQQWASAAGLPYFGAGGYRNETLTDRTIFDFYNHLLDGDNKREWQKWDVWELELSNTFLENRVGYNVAYFRQELEQGMWTPLGWDAGAVRIDIMERLLDGSPNPNVGRAFVGGRTVDMGSFTRSSDREAWRAQLFGAYDFERRHTGWWAKLLGEQRLTGVMSEEDQNQDNRSLSFAGYDLGTQARFGPRRAAEEGGYDYGQPGFKYYVSGDLRGMNSPSGARVSNLSMPFAAMTDYTGPMRWFDPTWTASGVNFADPWVNPQDPESFAAPEGGYTQANNPANYRGWTDFTGRYVTMNSKQPVNGLTPRDFLTQSATLANFNVKSTVAVWQGTMLDHAIVGIYGYRRDKSYRYEHTTSSRQRNGNLLTGGADLNPATYNYSNPTALMGSEETTTRNWSAMLHVNRLLGKRDFLPVNLRLYYNKGENFQPVPARYDVYLRQLAPPSGETEDISVMLSTKDDKYSLRATKYETSIKNATSTDGKLQADWALEQILGDGLGWDGSAGGILRGYLNGRHDYNSYGTPEQIERLKTSIIPQWLAFEKELKEKFPEFVNAWMGSGSVWGTDRTDDYPRVAKPAGVVATEDSVSKGYEIEFIANPTNNWRLALNASRTEATRTNVPGEAWTSVINYINDKFQNTDVGMAPIWWPQNNMGMRNFGPYPWNFYPDWVRVQALNGQSAGEVRKYRANAITNYTFDSGRLKGVGIGGGYRWEDKSVIAYAPKVNEDGTLGINLDAPFYAPREETVDLWVSYTRKLRKGLHWRIQLNVYNVGGQDDLIPITAGVDYTRLAEIGTPTPTTVVPMRGYGYAIKQGMSWQLTNTIEF